MSKIWRQILLFSLVAALALTSVQSARSQGNVPIPPRVIATTPALREVVGPDSSLTVTFDQAMDRASVEAAFLIDPKVDGKLSWNDDSTLVFTPASPLARGKEYTINIAATAKAKTGTALDDRFRLTFQIAPNLGVGQVIPAPDAQNVEAKSTITVVFDRPVVPLVNSSDQASLPQPLTLSPVVPGTGEWVGTAIYVFHPTKPLAGSTTYTATISSDLKDVDGTSLTKPYTWKFSTTAPRVQSITPSVNAQQVLLDENIVITFNQPMDAASTIAAFTVRSGTNGASVAGTAKLSADGQTLTFQPASKWEMDTMYQAAILAGAKSATGQATLSNPSTTSFRTVPYPKVIQTVPQNGEKVVPSSGVSIQFNTPMDAQSFANKVHIDPKPDKLQVNGGGNGLYLSFEMLPATVYTITLDAGVLDMYGNPTREATTFSFTTLDQPPALGYALSNGISVTSAYRPDTKIEAAAINISEIDAQLSALTLPELLVAQGIQGYQTDTPYRVPRVTRSWKIPITAPKNKRTDMSLDLVAGSGALKPGGYYLQLQSPDLKDENGHALLRSEVLIVATANLTIKTSEDQALVWATDLKSGQPVPNAQVTVYDVSSQNVSPGTLPKVIASGTTDTNGLLSVKLPVLSRDGESRQLLVTATGDNLFALTLSNWIGGFESYSFKVNPENPVKDVIYLYSDQPVYRPGHPAYFRGIVRNQNDVTFTVPTTTSVHATITDAKGQKVFDQSLPLNAYGAFNGKYDVPQNAPLGSYNLNVEYTSQLAPQNPTSSDLNLEVAEYRPPEYLVTATADASEVAAGDTIHVTVDAKFVFGGAVSAGKVTWNAIANQHFFNYTGLGNYEFSSYNYYDDTNGYVYNRPVGQGEGTLDDKGQFTIDLPADLAKSTNPQDFTIEATITDESNQPISGRTTVVVHPAKLYIGLQPSAYVGSANKPLDINLITVDWASKALANQNVSLQVISHSWEQDPTTLQYNYKSTPITDGKVTTDDQGKAVYTFTPPQAGIYEVQATARDGQERQALSAITVWVQGPNAVSWSRDKYLTLIADKKHYNSGDTANVLITSPFAEPVQALITVERAEIVQTKVVTITGSYTYSFTLDDASAPNIYLSAILIRGSGPDNKIIPEARYGLVNLLVAVKQQLTVKISPSVAQAQPGDTVKLDVLSTDLAGEPVAAEIGLSMTDLANLSVGRANSNPIFDTFWYTRGLSVETSAATSQLIDGLDAKNIQLQQYFRRAFAAAMPAPGGAGNAILSTSPAPVLQEGQTSNAAKSADGVSADKSLAAPTPRTNFVDTPLWLPSLITGADGHATTNVTLPDNLTTWRLNARAISAKTYVGDGTLDIISTKPLLVRPATPRFFVVGDEAELAMVVNNNTDQDLTVNAKLDAKGVILKADANQQITVPKAGRTRITWLATVQDVQNVDLTFSAVSGSFSDASKPAVGLGDQRLLPVYQYQAPDYVSTAGTLIDVGTRTEAVVLPAETLAPTGDLTVKLNPSLAAATLDGLDYLRNYPYQCLEQTVSKFLPNLITYRALQKLHLDKPALRDNLDQSVQYALERLKREQHPDGGWGWFVDEPSETLTTTYALLGLIEAKASDFQIDKDMLNRAIAYLQQHSQQPTDQTPGYLLNREAFRVYVLARAGNANTSRMDELFTRREKMHIYARAFLAQAYHAANGDQSKVDTLLSDIQTAAITSATGTHWEEGYWDYWNWGSDTRTTAIALQTLVELTPKSALIPNIVRWLMVARRGDAWETTQETAWAVMALTNWMDISGELKANYTYNVSVNGKALGDGTANADTLRDTKTLQVSVTDMLRDQANKIAIIHSDGPGSLYYTATLHVNQPVEAIKPTNRGFELNRTYYIGDKPVTSAKVGDTITAVLEITTSSDMYFANIEDPIPAGTELVNQGLQTTTQIGKQPSLESIDIARRGWGWWWFSNNELRTEKIVLSSGYLPRGSYRFVYQVQATTPGTYRVIPANGQEFYFPEVFGRSAGSTFTVTQ